MKIKNLILIIFLLCCIKNIFAQRHDQNYIRTKTYTKDNKSDCLEVIQYFNDLGYHAQTVYKGISPLGADLVSMTEYDNLGRRAASWLPAEGTGDGAYTDPQFVKQNAASFYGDTKPFSKPVYDGSPLNRVTEQYGPGTEWHNNKKAVKIERKTNDPANALLNCIEYSVSNNRLTKAGNYKNGDLLVIETTDEEGNKSYKFTDKTGQTLLVRLVNDDGNYDTYYVYDKYGNPCFVLPPLVKDNISDNNLKLYAYIYKYDEYKRMTEKLLPGCDTIEYVYDKGDKLIFWRDGEMRYKKQWMFSIPDYFGRVVLTGICEENALGLKISNNNFNSVLVKAKKSTNFAAGFFGYDIDIMTNGTTVTQTNMEGMKALTVNWFDDYDFFNWKSGLNNAVTGIKYNTEPGYDPMYGNTDTPLANRGLLTGSATAMLDDETYLYSAFYYDWRGLVVQTKSTNHLGGLEKEYVQYDFTGKPLKKMHSHTAPQNQNLIEEFYFEYDHAGRLKKITHKLNDNTTEKTIVNNNYDEVGRIKNTKNGILPLISYSYDVRSRLKTIDALHFEQALDYTLSGNISKTQWRNSNGNGYTDCYDFEYDQLSRLKKAKHTNLSTGQTGLYDELFEYDKHGNIKELKRYTLGTGFKKGIILADDLQMEHTGNQLKCVVDKSQYKSTSANEYFFMDWGKNPETEFFYNANGAMTTDENKGMSVKYNILNLPKEIKITNPLNFKSSISYNYSADGVKRRVTHSWVVSAIFDPGIIADTVSITEPPENEERGGDEDGKGKVTALKYASKTTDYVGNKIYIDGKLDKILLGNGYISGGNYHFYISDHLGSNRVVISEMVNYAGNDTIPTNPGDPGGIENPKGGGTMGDLIGEIVQRNNFYASGLPFPNGLGAEIQPFKYNDKEFDTMHGLNLYDYGARMLDPAIGPRWLAFDPLAELYVSWSPYVYLLNNPMRWIDIDGRGVFPSAAELRAAGLDVVNDPQYLRNAEGKTQCNFGAQAINRASGDRSLLGTANAMGNSLRNTAIATPLTQEQALNYANEGAVVWVSWVNPTGASGHIAVVAPGEGNFTIFNVGSSNGEMSVAKGFDKNEVGFFILNADKATVDNRIPLISGGTLGEVTVTASGNLYERILEKRNEMLKKRLDDLANKMRALEQSQADSELNEIKFWHMQSLIRQAEEIRRKGEPVEKVGF